MKLFITISFVLFLTLSCSEEKNQPLIGEWSAVDEHNGQIDKYIFTIEESIFGNLSGSIKTYINNSALPTTKINQIDYKHPNFTFYIISSGLKIQFAGNISGNTMLGKFSYSDPKIEPKKLILTKSEKNNNIIYKYSTPAEDQFPTANLADVKMNEEKITKLVQKTLEGGFGEMNSLLILKDNKLVLEEYFNEFDRNKLHHIQSCTKSITSILIGLAIDKGFIRSVNEKIITYLPGLKYVNGWENVSIKDLLTMSSGVEWIKEDPNSFWDKDDGVASILEKSIKNQPGSKFDYNSAMQVLALIIENATKTNLIKFAEDNLFFPLNIKNYKWGKSEIDNLPLCTGALYLLPIDMLKIGQLILQKGKFDNKQVISENWINESTKEQIKVPNNRGDNYGYLWWIGTEENRKIYAHGIGSQFIFIVPKYELIVVTTGNNIYNNKYLASFEMLNDYILKSIE
jgi:CubicO group peptidase (beta-lactamase class C family)